MILGNILAKSIFVTLRCLVTGLSLLTTLLILLLFVAEKRYFVEFFIAPIKLNSGG